MSHGSITHSPNISGKQACTSETIVQFSCFGSVTASTFDLADSAARAEANEVLIKMTDEIAKWISGLSCGDGCRLEELEIEKPHIEPNPLVPKSLVIDKDDKSIFYGLHKLIFGGGERVVYVCSYRVLSTQLVLCIPKSRG